MLCKKILSIIICILYLLALAGTTGCGNHVKSGLEDNAAASTLPAVTKSSESSIANEAELISDAEKDRNTIKVEYKLRNYEKKVKPYKVANDLSNITNLDQFGEFTQLQKGMLSKNGFVVTASTEEQLFYVYENNSYLKIPSFITADSVLQVYHVFYDYSLRTLEQQKLLGALEQLTGSMLDKSMHVYESVENPDVKTAALKNTAYFAVAQMALESDLPGNLPEEARQLADAEYKLVSDQKGFEQSAIFPFKLDYSQFKPRGHYTRNEDFERYFKAMMWYGLAPFPLYIQKDGSQVRDVEQTTQALLVAYSLFLKSEGSTDGELWERIYGPTVFYVGSADDLNIYQYKELLIKTYGKHPDIEKLTDSGKLDLLYKEADKLPEPQIKAKWVSVDMPAGKQFRFMGQRYIPDSEILQELVEPMLRPMPSGLDIMGVLDSDRAYDILMNEYKVGNAWPGYDDAFKKIKDKFSKISDSKWQSDMYYGWLWTLKSLLNPFGKGYPSFMTNQAWQDKSLNTALGSWSELRHDTILYGKQSGAECGGGAPPLIRSYVEPNIEMYEKLLWLTRYSKENLTAKDILTEDMLNRMQSFENLLDFLITCSIKELKNEELTTQEYDRLLLYGGILESLTSSLAEDNLRWFEITSDTDRNMAVVADVHTVPGRYLEAGVGPASQIFVVVPIGGQLYLTRGAVFSYYEFESQARLTDEEWQKMLKEQMQPSRPGWTGSFEEGKKGEIPTPEEPYDSGC